MPNVKKSKLTDNEVHAILKAAMPYRRDYLILKLLVNTGMRINELLRTTVRLVDFTRLVISIPAEHSKNKTPGEVLFNEDTSRFLRQWINDNRLKPQDRLFDLTPRAAQLMVKKYASAAGIDKMVTPHSFRHWFGTNVYKKYPDLYLVKSFLRQKSITSPEDYTHIVTDEMREWHAQLMKDF